MADWLKDFMGRTPFAILGAIGLLSMASQFINLADDIENWLKVWKAVTRPVWEWIAGLVGLELPNWLKDYLTVGVIHAGMMTRMILFAMSIDEVDPTFRIVLAVVIGSIFWPISFAAIIFFRLLAGDEVGDELEMINVYAETLVYFLILLAISGGLVLTE